MFPFPPLLPGEAMFAVPAGTPPSRLPPLTSWPMPAEEPFPCTQDRHLVYGSPAMPYTLHACWGEVPCMEWRFAVRSLMGVTERKVARITEENQACVRTYQRFPEGIVGSSYDFRPAPAPSPPVAKILSIMVSIFLVIMLLVSP